MSQGFALGYFEAKLEEIKETVAPLAQDLAVKIEDEVIPPEGLVSWMSRAVNL